MEKETVQKLTDLESDRVVYEAAKGKSIVWKHFVHDKVDGEAVQYVKCAKYQSVLHWKSRDGTSGLRAHIDYCNSARVPHSQPKITACAGFSAAMVPKLPAAVKSDATDIIVCWCAKDIRFVDGPGVKWGKNKTRTATASCLWLASILSFDV